MKLVRILKSFLSMVGPTVIVILVLEAVLRIGAFLWKDYSEYYLFYGFHSLAGGVGISPWWVYDGGHYKFPPNYTLRGAAGQGGETATTNSLGFRGPEFEPVKPPGVFRVIELGESSTFGYHNSDTGTYPYLLGQLFAERRGNPRVEVINAGFPYYNTGSVRSLLSGEVLDYDPDLITLYAAYNDTGWPLQVSAAARAVVWIQQHSMIYLLLKETVVTDQRVYKARNTLLRWLPQVIDPRTTEEHIQRVAARYRDNVEAIADMAESRGVQLVLIRQPMTARYEDPEMFPSYEAEYETIVKGLSEGKPRSPFEFDLVVHRRLIRELDAIARERGLPVVDNIAIVDQDRRRLTSWVHLTEEANLRLAEALKETIEPLIPGEGPGLTQRPAALENRAPPASAARGETAGASGAP